MSKRKQPNNKSISDFFGPKSKKLDSLGTGRQQTKTGVSCLRTHGLVNLVVKRARAPQLIRPTGLLVISYEVIRVCVW
jgi:hypothetical protein